MTPIVHEDTYRGQNTGHASGSQAGSSDASSSGSMSIYDRYPNLPKQLREIVEYQTFRIANM